MLQFSLSFASYGAGPVFEVRLNEDGQPQYRLLFQGKTVLDWAKLGMVCSDEDWSGGFERMRASEPVDVEVAYTLTHGKCSHVRRRAREVRYRFFRKDKLDMALRVRIFDDGVAFRYELDHGDDAPVTLLEEKTTFVPAAGMSALVVQKQDGPGSFSPAYEYHMFGRGLRNEKYGYCFPMLFGNEGDSIYLLLGEAGLTRDHCGFRLRYSEGGPLTIGLPDPHENPVAAPAGPVFSVPWKSPWRLLIVGDSLATIVESTLPTDVSPPSKIEDTSWIKPGFASWSWWSDSNSPKSTEKLKRFIDMAADFGWEYSLVDANWRREDVPELVAYARERGVGLFYWYNSGGENNAIGEQPRDRMTDKKIRRREMAWLQQQGIAGIKVDFFNSDKQTRIKQYLDILEDAADFRLMVNFHGCTLPRGWQRTYPHLMTMEAVRGGESYKLAGDWWNKLAPMHNVNVALTRNVMGPVDYTPGIVSRNAPKYKTCTTAAHELALGVVFHSGITHWCDSVEAYRGLDPPVKELLRDLPRTWDETRLVSTKPADHVVLARRSGDRWYLAGISGRGEAMSLELPWEEYFQEGAKVLVYNDGPDGRIVGVNWENKVVIKPFGGFLALVTGNNSKTNKGQ